MVLGYSLAAAVLIQTTFSPATYKSMPAGDLKQTDRQMDRHKQKEIDRQTHTHVQIDKQAGIKIDRQIDRLTNREANR